MVGRGWGAVYSDSLVIMIDDLPDPGLIEEKKITLKMSSHDSHDSQDSHGSHGSHRGSHGSLARRFSRPFSFSISKCG